MSSIYGYPSYNINNSLYAAALGTSPISPVSSASSLFGINETPSLFSQYSTYNAPAAPATGGFDMMGMLMILKLLMSQSCRPKQRHQCPPQPIPLGSPTVTQAAPVTNTINQTAAVTPPTTTSTTVVQTTPPARQSKTVTGGATLGDSYTDYQVFDDSGIDTFTFKGDNNTFTVTGDRDPNTFHVGGTNNKATIYEIGSDDHVYLEGGRTAWKQQGQGQDGNGVFYTYFNDTTKTTAKIYSDHNNFEFLDARIH